MRAAIKSATRTVVEFSIDVTYAALLTWILFLILQVVIAQFIAQGI